MKSINFPEQNTFYIAYTQKAYQGLTITSFTLGVVLPNEVLHSADENIFMDTDGEVVKAKAKELNIQIENDFYGNVDINAGELEDVL